MPLTIDHGIRKVDAYVVMHAQFKNSERLKQVNQTTTTAQKRPPAREFVLLGIQVNNNEAGYPFRWFLGEIVEDMSTVLEAGAATFQVQIYRASTVISLTSK